MAIWNDKRIYEWINSGGVENADQICINPASLDLRWSGRYRIAGLNDWNEQEDCDSLLLVHGAFYLLDTLEYVKMPDNCVGKLFLKSSAGRMGIEHLHAGYVDPGFEGTLTLEIELRVRWPITIERGARLVQLTIEEMVDRPAIPYAKVGRYSGQRVPTRSKGLPK